MRRAAKQHAGLGVVSLGNGDDVATLGAGQLDGLVALNRKDRAGAHRLAGVGDQFRAVIKPVANHARKRKPPDRTAIGNLEDARDASVGADPLRCFTRGRRFVAEQFEQPPNAKAAQR